MKTAEQRKQLSIETLKNEGIAYIDWLPVIENESKVQLKTPLEIAKRLIACMLCIQASFVQKNDDYDVEVVIFYQKLLKQFQIDNLTEKELIVFEQKGDEQDLLNMTWKYEACWALLWALGFVDELKFPNEPMTHDDRHFAIEVVSNNATIDDFLSKIKMRSLDEILDQSYLHYLYNKEGVDVRIDFSEHKENENGIWQIDTSAVMDRSQAMDWLADINVALERSAGLDWLFRTDANWDYPDLNT